ncbi:MAG: 3-hydroxyacyl-CoA dehydrogenase NAD-binding domain-containing protein [Vicinamibacterales bacterium]
MTIHRAAVLGAGTMGAQIAAHLANAGVPAVLLDLSVDVARQGLERAKAISPGPFFTKASHALITLGSFDDLGPLAECDWIVEAVVERLDVKQSLLDRVETHASPAALVSSNTSAIPLHDIADGRSEALRARWLGTHFFNPPRYLPLLEVIPTSDTRADVLEAFISFADRRLGKGVVVAKDAPGFVANRIGLYGVMQILRAVADGEYTVEEVDAITGRALGRPKSATFRTVDLAGLDVLAHVAGDLSRRLPGDEGAAFAVPAVVEELVRRGSTGAKAGRGFYRKEQSGEITAIDFSTFEYRAPVRPRLPSIDAARSIDDVGERIRTLFLARDRTGEFLRRTLAPALLYAAKVAPVVAHAPDDVDRAMRWGFGWELGPFETLRAIGVDEVLAALGPAGDESARTVLTASQPLASDASDQSPAAAAAAQARSTAARLHFLKTARASNRIVRRNAGASLVDIGDGVLCVEFHAKMNAIGGDAIQMLQLGVKEAAANFAALVVANDAAHFSAGANLMLLLLEAQEGNWDEVDLMVRAFQQATMSLKHADVPVVVCPAGMTLGGGCEIALHAHRVQAAAETYMGLVEVSVGLIPAGGGTKEMLARAMETLPAGAEALPYVQQVFETIGFATVSTSAADARTIGYLRDADGITMNRDRVLADARAIALARTPAHVPPRPRTAVPVGGATVLAALKLGVHLAWRAGRISDHDALIGRKLAWVLAGGNTAGRGTMTEQQLLDLEREAFLSLCGERKTQERIAHTLKTGKPLRN